MFSDIDLLERYIGREGPEDYTYPNMELMRWASSTDASRAAAHALAIKKRAETMPVLEEPPVHFPRSLFVAGLVLFCYTKLVTERRKNEVQPLQEHFSEFSICGLNVNSLFREAGERVGDFQTFQRLLAIISKARAYLGHDHY
jgi:hypothetical protein